MTDPDARGHRSADPAAAARSYVSDALSTQQPDARGFLRLDMTKHRSKAAMREAVRVVHANRWRCDTLLHEDGHVIWVLRQQNRVPLSPRDHSFINGPSQAQLRNNTAARQEAARIVDEHGLDPLSEAVFDQTARTHAALRRRATRYGALATFCGLALLVTVLLSFSSLTSPGVPGLYAVLGVLAAGSMMAAVLCARTERARRTAIQPFVDAYHRVAVAAMRSNTAPHAE